MNLDEKQISLAIPRHVFLYMCLVFALSACGIDN
jgi:hypothetical protein